MGGGFFDTFVGVFSAIDTAGKGLASNLTNDPAWVKMVFVLCFSIELCLTIIEGMFSDGLEVLAEKGVKLMVMASISLMAFVEWPVMIAAATTGGNELTQKIAGVPGGNLGLFVLEKTGAMVDKAMALSVYDAGKP